MATLYESILSLCSEKGIKGGKMCTDLGLSKSLMTGLKNGTKKGITSETAQKIADYFDVSVGRVLGLEGEKSIEVVHAQLSKSEIEAWRTIQSTASRVLGDEKEKSPAPEGAELKISDDDMRHLKKFHRADPATKEAIRLLLLKFEEEQQ